MSDRIYLLGIDIGTTTSKGVITTVDGEIVVSAGFEHDISRPQPEFAEHDADAVWWGDFVQVCRQLLERSGIDPKKIVSVGLSTLYPTLVPVDRKGNALRPGILYGIDRRALDEIGMLRGSLGEEYCLRVTGNGLSTQSIGPKMMWIARHEPSVFEKTYKFLNAGGYIVGKLTGRFCMDHGSASLGGVPYSLVNSGWDEEAARAVGIRMDQLPELLWADDCAGFVTAEAARITGLAEGTPVTPGTGDHVTESLSQGYVCPGAAGISYGTTFGIDVCTDKMIIVPGISLTRSCFEDLYTIGGGMLNGCSLTRWFRDQLSDTEATDDIYAYFNEKARDIPAGCDGLLALPYFGGEKIPFFDPSASGVLFGLHLQHTRYHIYRALLESVAFSVRHTLECVESAGFEVEQAISTGGGTAGDVWTQIVSDVTGLRQQVLKASHGSPMGASFLGGLMCGAIMDRSEIFNWNEVLRWVEPSENQSLIRLYDERYRSFRMLYENTKDIMKNLR